MGLARGDHRGHPARHCSRCPCCSSGGLLARVGLLLHPKGCAEPPSQEVRLDRCLWHRHDRYLALPGNSSHARDCAGLARRSGQIAGLPSHGGAAGTYSHSILPRGFEGTSSTTRLTSSPPHPNTPPPADGGRLPARVGGPPARGGAAGTYSHSIVPGGFEVTSSTTRLTSATSFVIRVEIRARTSLGMRLQSAVMASSLETGRKTMGCP